MLTQLKPDSELLWCIGSYATKTLLAVIFISAA